jgi:hypothetical protein
MKILEEGNSYKVHDPIVVRKPSAFDEAQDPIGQEREVALVIAGILQKEHQVTHREMRQIRLKYSQFGKGGLQLGHEFLVSHGFPLHLVSNPVHNEVQGGLQVRDLVIELRQVIDGHVGVRVDPFHHAEKHVCSLLDVTTTHKAHADFVENRARGVANSDSGARAI